MTGRMFILAVATLLAVACGSSSTTPTAATTLHGEVSDPLGDAHNANYPQFTNPPDLIHGTVDVAAGAITFTITLAPGTFDPQTTVLLIDLDTDQNVGTGQARNGIGVDYSLTMGAATFGNPPLGSSAWVLKFGAAPGPFGLVGTAPVTMLANGMAVTVPLSVLGNSTGRMNFHVQSLVQLTTISAAPFDDMPDAGLPPGALQ